MTRWEAERWAAGYERRLSPLAATGLRVAVMQLAIESRRDAYLGAAFDRLEAVVAAAPWAAHRCDGACDDPDHRLATTEIVGAVTELTQQALAASVLADELAIRPFPPVKVHHLDRAVEVVLGGSDRNGSDR
jgi:hypothetical protein